MSISTLVILSGLAHAKDGERIEQISQLCITDKKTGFNWRNGEWQAVIFREKKFTIKKVNPISGEGIPKDKLHWAKTVCGYKKTPEDYREYARLYNVCLRITDFGDGYSKYKACDELHFKGKNGQWSGRIECPELIFWPNGYFHREFIHADLSKYPKDDYKDSLTISVGKCANF